MSMEIKGWCKPYLAGVVVKVPDSDPSFIVIKCDGCSELHKAMIIGNSYKSRNHPAVRKVKVEA